MSGFMAGQQITANVRLVRPLSRGGMGSVWLAEHTSLRTDVVVKFLAEALAEDTTSRTRFAREASAAAQVKSPHVVQMLDHGITPDGSPYIVMEYLEGRDLKQELRRRGRMTAREVASMLDQLSRALDRAHEKGIIHRDIKPANIFLMDVGGGEPFVKLLDFGIAKASETLAVTTTGDVVGTPMFMSPEQLQGHEAGPPTDLWSLGVCAFRAMTGVNLFEADSVGAVALKVLQAPMPRPTSIQADIPIGVDEWFSKACARDPNQRFRTAREMAHALWAAIGDPREATGDTTRRQMALGQTPVGGAPAASDPGAVSGEVHSSSPELTGSLGSSVKQAVRPPAARRTGLVAAVAIPFVLAGIYVATQIGAEPQDTSGSEEVSTATEPPLTPTAAADESDEVSAKAPAASASAPSSLASADSSAAPSAPPPKLVPPPRPVPPRPPPVQPPPDPDDIGF